MKIKDIVEKSYDGTRFDVCNYEHTTLFLGTGLDIYKSRDLIIETQETLWDTEIRCIECYHDDELNKSVIMLMV